MKAKFSIPLATLFLGFIPMLIMSILTKTFWINSQYNEPFVVIPAFLIGDSLLLPPLNYLIYLAHKQVIHLLEKKTTFLIFFYSFLLSIILNSYTHYLWTHDIFLGPIETQFGVLSLAGWWHYGYSVLQFTIIFSFTVIWILTVKLQTYEVFKVFEKTTYLLMIFNLVNMSGVFINKDLILYKRLSPNITATNIMTASSPLIIAIILLFSMKKIRRSIQA